MATDTAWYRVGTITVAKDKADVTGAGTGWTGQVREGDLLWGPDGRPYEVAQLLSATALKLRTAYQGNTASAQPYAIVRNFTDSSLGEVSAELAKMQRRWLITLGGFRDVLLTDQDKATLYDELGQPHEVMSWPAIDKAAKAGLAAMDAARKVVVDNAAELVASRNAAKASETAAGKSAATATAKANEAGASATAAAGSAATASAKATETATNAEQVAKAQAEVKANTAKVAADAAKAKTDADRAAAAAQVNIDVVAATSIPLPDVWLPLTSDLRFITGIGCATETLRIGDDEFIVPMRGANFDRASTATYIDKAGRMQTAQANEPRFGRDGLLIEGQVTNLLQNSVATVWGGGGSGQAKARPDVDFLGWKGVVTQCLSKDTPANGCIGKPCVDVGNGMATSSCYLKLVNPQSPVPVALYGHASITASGQNALAAFDLEKGEVIETGGADYVSSTIMEMADGWYFCTVTFKTKATPSSGFGCLPWARKPIPLGDDQGFYVACPQLEQRPFASSYIPTSGTPVTRAPDHCWIDGANIAQALTGNQPMTIAMEVYANSVDAWSFALTSKDWRFSVQSNMSAKQSIAQSVSKSPAAADTRAETRPSFSPDMRLAVAVLGAKTGTKVMLGGMLSSNPAEETRITAAGDVAIGNSRTGSRSIAGRIRNLRIWHRVLTDAQIKALA
ncbi:hypothetical protein BUE93_05815 [Chromobacterium amazonense]|uniref:LamG-like jellyroll fold domain-containing protein n=1 Tax=Chromobacterium amazonense TaxID=1382803 RepID=A0A2S9X728_9NEIS|nr:LamG-like jellyroll fold domain-containing protein [Chromobacterium amazonense]PRP71514.1 hypothetical protein BUE93_05815 [Chromobacterium amazonense]